ncbi:hypothetical protein PRK78_000376 [Emydomyces testavorans]|uniref:CBF1-interacting co-repressor CIR N-terminal domain-containing protein n=1 Tax=Emydomyces testavorans TaxID=2070801 RepID=A0AAF0DBA7_9EURO|nr:hypothetical protein PRK78_000376 [Emydomyces testavorans]
MPLHLLGKKSWNVYNRENIARVRRDEALAKVCEEEDERRVQGIDAERRIEILRGQRVSPSLSREDVPQDRGVTKAVAEGRHRKRRRLAGEDDTDRDIRLAREDVLLQTESSHERTLRKSTSDAPLLDASGHISLFPKEAAQHIEKNEDVEAEAAKKKQEYEDQYTMRFSNAAGYKQGMEAPWYSTGTHDLTVRSQEIPAKDVWGNEDPRRREREKMRIDANDPLAAMKRGVRQLREVEKERKQWEAERKRELDSLKWEDKDARRRRRKSQSYDSIDDFRLDEAPADEDKRKKHRSHRYLRGREHRSSRREGHSERHEHHSSRHGHKKGTRKEPPKQKHESEPSSSWAHAPGKKYSAQFAGL